jgi:hypothetical protein
VGLENNRRDVMRKRNYEYLGVPLELRELLKGFDSSIFSPSKTIIFKRTENLFEKNYGQVAWIKKQILEWVSLVNLQSGTKVVRYKFFKGHQNWQKIRSREWKITFEFEIPGTVNFDRLHQALSKKISKFFKKFLAEELLLRFPLPFSVHDEIPFCAGASGIYLIKPIWLVYSENIEPSFGDIEKVLSSKEFRLRLKEVFRQYSAQLVSIVKNMGEKKRVLKDRKAIFVRWEKHTTRQERHNLAKEIDTILKEMGVLYQFPGQNPSPLVEVGFEF